MLKTRKVQRCEIVTVAAYPLAELLICAYVMSMVGAVKREERIRLAVARYQFVSETPC